MNRSLNHDPSLEPSGRMSTMRIAIGLFGAPVAWIAQVFLSEPLAAYACYPYRMPLSAPIWERLPVMLATIGIACFTVALLSGLVAWRLWRQFDSNSVGENRNRFLVKLGVMSSFIFIVATLFNMCAVLLVSPCSAWV
ncbi:hypothetical protein [Methylobacter sp.]|uniref:hypothetical protein n=2 Tax=Methylobacter sp. TaxID=2051955 RepID=UPI0024874C51|nr:hypothetical protein [Methylobacter sp.]MDI1279349.1 hypothetical protein [Methylobacter sp.]MDI1359872.1 hypothetical protein [Methylobacter sp.]